MHLPDGFGLTASEWDVYIGSEIIASKEWTLVNPVGNAMGTDQGLLRINHRPG